MTPLLEQINEANDIKKIAPEQYARLAGELRRFLIGNVSKTGGHLASNLGAVELTMALHLFLDFPKDKLIWDVGHQSYVHKILTGRKQAFSSLRQLDGISGFPKPKESACDAFATGHSSTSISAALGMVKARELRGTDETIVAVIGDGALSGGMAFEALNNAGRLKSNFIIVLNDNDMSISENVGAMANYLGRVRTSQTYGKIKDDLEEFLNRVSKTDRISKALKRTKDSIKQLFVSGMLFENIGLTYIGPIDGHNIERMTYAFELAAQADNATLVHVVTKKGKGYAPAERNPIKFHGIGAFDANTGEAECEKQAGQSYTEVFGQALVSLSEENPAICAVTAAMMSGTGLTEFAKRFPKRFFDVGIAEEHAVTFAAGLACGGFRPVVAVYSTFLQRAYDQILLDVCMEQLPVVFAVDRNGIVGNDGETHQGIFTHSYLGHIPGLVVMEPSDATELRMMLAYAFRMCKPVAICYPRGLVSEYPDLLQWEAITEGKAAFVGEKEANNPDCALMAVGPMVGTALAVQKLLKERGVTAQVLNMRFISPPDVDTVVRYAGCTRLLVTLEENVKRGGFSETVAAILAEHCETMPKLVTVALSDEFLPQGTAGELRIRAGLDADSITERIMKEL